MIISASKDIGAYDTCLHRCKYCYANRSDNIAAKNFKEHRKKSPSLLGWYECKSEDEELGSEQLSLFDSILD